jgi:glycosyltransferase involved in cell wall biosynthesis
MSVCESAAESDPCVGAERLLFVTHEFPPAHGGAGTVTREWARAAADLGWKVEVLAPGESDPADSREPYPVVRMGHRGRQDFRARRALLQHLRARPERPGERWIISEPGALRALLDPPARSLPPAPGPAPVVLLHGSEILRLTGRRALRDRLGAFLEKAALVVVLSAANRALLRKCLPGLSTECRVVPGAASGPRGEEPVDCGPSSRVGADRLTLLTVGRIHPRKGQREVLAALRALPAGSRARIRYRLVGPAVHAAYARRLRREIRRADFPVEWSGPLGADELEDAYRAADLFILASQPYGRSLEGFGLVYLEAGRHGLPVLGTRNGGVGEAIADGETGLLVPPGNTAALAAAIERLLGNPEERARLGTAGRERAISWTWREAVASVLGRPAGAKTD